MEFILFELVVCSMCNVINKDICFVLLNIFEIRLYGIRKWIKFFLIWVVCFLSNVLWVDMEIYLLDNYVEIF